MSATPAPDVERTIEHSRAEDVTPVRLDAASLDSTAPGYLRDLKRELTENGFYPAGLSLSVCFEDDCSLSTQETVDRIREHVRAAALIGAGTVTVEVGNVANEAKVRPALRACVERAHREGVTLEIDGPLTIEA